MKEELKDLVLRHGACELKVRRLEPPIYGLSYALSIAYPLLSQILDRLAGHPDALYYHHYRQVNFALDRIALEVATLIQDKGYKAMAIPASQIIDWPGLKAEVSHKEIAQQAGIGWIGRSSLVVHPRYGAQIRLVSVLTNLKLSADEIINRDCGECKQCIAICPAQAIKEDPRDFQVNKCILQLKEFVRKRYTGQYICGLCQKACTSWA